MNERNKEGQRGREQEREKGREKERIKEKNIFLPKAGQPKICMSSSGKMMQLETPGTRRAKELFDLYQLLDSDEDVEGEDRLPALHAVAEMVKNGKAQNWRHDTEHSDTR